MSTQLFRPTSKSLNTRSKMLYSIEIRTTKSSQASLLQLVSTFRKTQTSFTFAFSTWGSSQAIQQTWKTTKLALSSLLKTLLHSKTTSIQTSKKLQSILEGSSLPLTQIKSKENLKKRRKRTTKTKGEATKRILVRAKNLRTQKVNQLDI